MNPGHANDAMTLLRCVDCGAWWALMPYACAHCGGVNLKPDRVSGQGRVCAQSEISRAPDDYWRARLPYALVLVQLTEGPTVMGQALGKVDIGDVVSASRLVLDDRTSIWQFAAVL